MGGGRYFAGLLKYFLWELVPERGQTAFESQSEDIPVISIKG